jgi:hypothetical protein
MTVVTTQTGIDTTMIQGAALQYSYWVFTECLAATTTHTTATQRGHKPRTPISRSFLICADHSSLVGAGGMGIRGGAVCHIKAISAGVRA